ncbi:MAG: hypothetical protein GEV03_00655 [Streptosporangiales bacterium]|nr:hypothetical protein [Streptosporangiales bacterium]
MNETEFVTRVEELPDRFAGRVPERYLRGLRDLVGGGEWDLVLEELLANLREDQAPITAQERDELAALLTYAHIPTVKLDELNATG